MATAAGRACIFCGDNSLGRSVSHIVPETLGGPGSPVSPRGVVCDACNQYFGQKVEAFALQSFPFLTYRLFQGIPSKARKMASLPTTLGKVTASGWPGRVHLDPRTEALGVGVAQGQATTFRILAEVTQPLAVARMLLKIGLETMGKYFYDVAVSDRLEQARTFCRRPKRGTKWWILLSCDPLVMSGLVSDPSDEDELAVEVGEVGGVLTAVLSMPGLWAMVPLDGGSVPDFQGELKEPEWRLVWAVC
jgi:hypothetical protein